MKLERGIVNSNTSSLLWQRVVASVITAALLLTLAQVFVVRVGAQTKSTVRGRAFTTPEDAANSLIDAAEKYDEAALMEIVGPSIY